MADAEAVLMDVDAERKIIGCMMLNPSCTDRIAHQLLASHFHDAELRNVFDVMILMHGVRRDVSDLGQVSRELKAEGKRFNASTLAKCADSVATSQHIQYYADKVIACAQRRVIDRAILDAKRDLSNASMTPAQIASNLEGRMSQTSDTRDDGIQEFDEVMTTSLASMQAAESSPEAVVSFGFPSLDNQFGRLFPGDLCIVGARPGVGKSKFSEQVAMHNGRQGRRVLIVSIEMQHEKYGSRALLSHAGIDGRKLRTGKPFSESEWTRLRDAGKHIENLPIGVQFRRKKQTVATIRSLAKMYQGRHGDLKLLVVDYLQLIRAENPQSPRYEQVTQISADLKSLALELNVPILAMCQLNRSAANEKPTMSQLRESGSIEQDADQVILLHRPEMQVSWNERESKGAMEVAEISVQKFRESATGDLAMTWDPLVGYVESAPAVVSEWTYDNSA